MLDVQRAQRTREAVRCHGDQQDATASNHDRAIGRTGHTRLGARPSVGGGRCPNIRGCDTCARCHRNKNKKCARFFALAVSSYHYLTGYCFWLHAGHVLVSHAPLPSASPDRELK